MLVAAGAAAFILLSLNISEEMTNIYVTRITIQVVVGVGFLGWAFFLEKVQICMDLTLPQPYGAVRQLALLLRQIILLRLLYAWLWLPPSMPFLNLWTNG